MTTIIDNSSNITITENPLQIVISGQGAQGTPGVGVPSGGTTLQILKKRSNTNYDTEWADGGSGTVTNVSVVTANGVSGSVANSTTTPAITLTLGNVIPSSVASSGTVTGSNLSGTNTGDQNLFAKIAVSGQSDIVADSIADTLTIAAGTNITITTDATTDTLTINASGTSSPAFSAITSGDNTSAVMVVGTGASLSASGSGTIAATSANILSTGRTIAITGDLAYTSPSFNGSGNVTAAGTLATVNSNVGSFGSATQSPTYTVNAKGLITAAANTTITPAIGSVTGLGTGVSTALGVNVGTAGALVVNGGALGTPSSGTLTNCTFPTLNQNTTGSAAKWTTARSLAGNSVDGSANVAFANKFIAQGTTDSGLSGAQFLGSLSTGIIKNTTSTGVLSIAVAGDFPTLNQNTTGSAGTVDTINGRITAGTNISITGAGTAVSPYNISSSGSVGTSFDNITTGENKTATMTVGTGASIVASGSGTIAATTAPASGITGTTLASNVVTSSLTTVGTIGTGTWQGTKIGLAYGGTNADLSATGGASNVLLQTSVGGNITVAQLAASNLSNGTTGSGSVVLSTSPALTTPSLGTPASGNLANCTFPTLNQNTTGSAAKWTTAINLAGNSVDGSANVAFANKFIVQGTTDTGLSAAQFLGALGTGIVKNTTTTGVLSIAVAGDFPTLNQNTTGSAATVDTINGRITAGTNISITGSGTSGSPYNISASGSVGTGFDNITSGNNTTAVMVVSTGASLSASGSGTITPTTINGLVTAGSNISITGSGTVASPYSIASTGGGGGQGIGQILALARGWALY
jgi:hypothetical protein